MIDKEGGVYVLRCDKYKCRAAFSVDASTRKFARSAAKKVGWGKFVQQDRCPDHVGVA